eukprot:gb/GFBE01053358.1/.p1 GENE.gb/GFBE01053358.1/~~gb/GFBE01053358.1/.p1  ORF type:complete len:408 (+),score=72.50 gb/GFBE01053358.1/:1-1224(+)
MENDYQVFEHEKRGRSGKVSAQAAAICFGLCAFMLVFWRSSTVSAQGLQHPSNVELVAGSNSSDLWVPPVLPVYKNEPLAKSLIRKFDLYLMNRATFDAGPQKLRNVGQWLAPEFIYKTVGFPSSEGLAAWCLSGEESQYRTAFPTSAFSQMLFFGDDTHATTTSYGNAHWVGDLFGVPAPKRWIYFRVTDFYLARKTGDNTGLIHWNFMMIDFADLLRRVGRPVLPKAHLPEGLVLTAAANDGVPAPLSVVAAQRDSKAAKATAKAALDGWARDLEHHGKWWHSDLTFYGPGGIGVARSIHEFHKHVLKPYHDAFSNRTVETEMLFCEGNYCGAYGKLWGHHKGTWVGQKASHRLIGIRFAMHWRITDGLVKESWAIFDMPGFFQQLGLDFWELARQAPSNSTDFL